MPKSATEQNLTAAEARAAMRRGDWAGMTVYKLPGYVQCNLVAIPRADALDFMTYCFRNRAACPVLDVTDPGDPEPRRAAPGADLRTDLPKYCVYEKGALVAEPHDVSDRWRDDAVAFLIGSSLTFDMALERAGVTLSPEVWVLRTEIDTLPAGRFHGRLIVTMRLFSPKDAIIATQLTSRFPWNHGAPRHIGDPAGIGADIRNPFTGRPLESIPDGVVPVFWDCGVTPQQAAIESKLDWMITHNSGHSFMADLRTDQICLP